MQVSDGVITMFDDVFAERASNSEVWDVEGKRYLDFSAGLILGYRAYIELAEKLNRIAPGSTPKKSVLFTTGAESVENAVKIARMYTKRPGIITFRGGFHGRTALTMAMTGKVMPYKKAIGSLPGDIYHIPMPVAHHHVSEADSLAALENLFMADIEADRVAALIMEPVMGEGGFIFRLKALSINCTQFAKSTVFCLYPMKFSPDLGVQENGLRLNTMALNRT
ncbi:hypothetical protein CHS0354_018558 [Potamilus streckersoni]|uniref:4-aminobutyrate aminotransferase n=1 Tax=Potamilus streckersoni TaxID=2493646 RepID=A0AAE0WB05_9BIVA|nr:hypothetical protein CHS0354_018558 [Potamilus streckersoni]